MRAVTNGRFAVLAIPECRQHSIVEWGERNGLLIVNDVGSYTYYAPYRSSRDRIMRGIAADLHELMHDQQIVNLNVSTWADAETVATKYIQNWIDTVCSIPVEKNFCHSSYYSGYVPAGAQLVDIQYLSALPNYLNRLYGSALDHIFPDLPDDFYQHTVPHKVIEYFYLTNQKFARTVDDFCRKDEFYTQKHFKFVDF